MAQNTNVSQLDTAQIVKRVVDSDHDSIRVILASGLDLAIELDSADGDNVAVLGKGSSTKASITTAETGTIVAAASCAGMKSFQLYTKTTSALTGAQVCTLEISPSDTDDVWMATSLTVTPSTSNGTVVMGTALTNVVARRARVVIASAISSGTFDIYLVVQGV